MPAEAGKLIQSTSQERSALQWEVWSWPLRSPTVRVQACGGVLSGSQASQGGVGEGVGVRGRVRVRVAVELLLRVRVGLCVRVPLGVELGLALGVAVSVGGGVEVKVRVLPAGTP